MKEIKAFFLFFFLALGILLSTSCRPEKKGSIVAHFSTLIDFDTTTRHYPIASMLDSVDAVDLQTIDSSVISDISFIKRVLSTDGKLFILDQKFNIIKVFDSAGKYLFDLGALGIGKGQSLNVEDIEFNFQHNQLMVLSNRPLKIMEFSFDGTLTKEEKLDFYSSAFAFPSENSRIFYTNQNGSDLTENENLLFTDTNNIVKSRLFDFSKNISSTITFSGGLYSTGHEVYYNQAYSNDIYKIDGDTAKLVFKTNYGLKGIPEGMNEFQIDQNFKNLRFTYNTFIKKGDYIGFNYRLQDTLTAYMCSAFFDSRSGKIATSEPNTDSLNVLFSNSMFENDSKLMMLLDATRLSGFIERNSNQIKQRFPDLYSKIHIQKGRQNPVLLTFKLKLF